MLLCYSVSIHWSAWCQERGVWVLVGASLPCDVIWCQWFRSGDSGPEYWRDRACSMCARWEILLITELGYILVFTRYGYNQNFLVTKLNTILSPELSGGQIVFNCQQIWWCEAIIVPIWHCVSRGAVCVPMLITVAKWSTASEIWWQGTPSSTPRRATPSRSTRTKISSWLRLVSGCSDCWLCKLQYKHVLTFCAFN